MEYIFFNKAKNVISTYIRKHTDTFSTICINPNEIEIHKWDYKEFFKISP